jgi:hypothetical protein
VGWRLGVLLFRLTTGVASLSGAGASAPVVVSANCFNGRDIGVCFSEVLDPISATNPANYSLTDPDFTVTEASLRPDQVSVLLRLSQPYPRPILNLLVRNVRDLEGNATATGYITPVNNLTASDVGVVGTDPREPGSVFNCAAGDFEVEGGGSGWGGTADAFHFICEPWRDTTLLVLVRVKSLEPVNALSGAGLMVRENLSPGSRYFSVLITPPDVPAEDGSGNGANTVLVRYRLIQDGPSTEVRNAMLPAPPYADVLLQVFRQQQSFVAGLCTNRAEGYSTVASASFAEPFSAEVWVGMATSSWNNGAGMRARAEYADYRILRGDFPISPILAIDRVAGGLRLSWHEVGLAYSYFPAYTSVLGSGARWREVPAPISRIGDLATVTIPLPDLDTFFRVELSR